MKPTSHQIIEALHHVRYEVESLLLTPAHDSSNEALVESVYFRKMAHGRVLYTFFTTPLSKRYSDDVLSEDFGFPAEQLYGVDREELLERFNKDLFHLTYTRLERTHDTKSWPMDSLLSPIARQSRRFIEHVIYTAAIQVSDSERDLWRALNVADTGGLRLQQNTSNVAAYQIQSIELNRGT